MKDLIFIKKDMLNVKKKIQTAYAFTLVIFTLLIIIADIASIYFNSTSLLPDITKSIILLILMGTVLSIPIYILQKKIEKADLNELKILNYIINVYYVLLSIMLIFIVYCVLFITIF